VDKNDIAANELNGVEIYESSYNTISYNTISGNDVSNVGGGIKLDSSSSNTLTGNNIRNNTNGISLWHSDNNTISRNDIVNNGKDLGPGWNPAGIYFGESYNNKIYHNNFIDNFIQVSCPWGQNVWDDGYPSGGNYWSDYTGIDADGDGIGDTAYVIPYMDQDNYPLMNPWTPPSIGAKAGDWIRYDYEVTGWPSGTPYPEWLKVEFLSVEGTNATVRVTMHMSDGTEQSDTLNVDVVTGGGTFDTFFGFVIPANCSTGDSIFMGGDGFAFNVTIDGETTRTYVGASRTVVYASFSQYGTELTYYWDKETGVMVEASMTSGGVTGTAKATETNMWEATTSPFWMQWWFYAIVAVVIVALAGAVYFLNKRKPPTPTAPPPPTEGTRENRNQLNARRVS